MKEALINFIGKGYRDLTVLFSGDFIEYFIKGKHFIYKNFLPFNMTIGLYKFLKSEDYYAQKPPIQLN